MRWLKAFCIILGLFSAIPIAYGQQTISGKVVDSGSSQPLSFVNIVVAGTEKQGTMTGLEGRFELLVKPEHDELRLSRVGYQTKFVSIDGVSKTTEIKMAEQQLGVEAVIIKPEANPAIPIIKKTIERRKANDPWKRKRFTLEAYNKYALTIDTQMVDSLADANRRKKTDSASFDTMNVNTTAKANTSIDTAEKG